MKQALEGIRVFDLTQWGVGPWASMQLGALGADVIHIEQPNIDWSTLAANIPPTINGTSIGYIAFNMNKRAFSLDLKSEAHRKSAYDLLKTCDVFLANMRPGVPERLGVGYEAVREINPRIVYCEVTGWGESGPMSALPGADQQAQHITGFTSTNGVEGGRPEVYRHYTQADFTTGNYAAQAITMALLARERTGKGQRVQVSMLRAVSAMQSARIGEFLQSGVLSGPRGSASQATAPDQAFECQDREWIGVAVTSDTEWAALCELIGQPELRGDERFRTNGARLDHRHELADILTKVFGSQPSDYWAFHLERSSIPFGFQMRWKVLRQHQQVLENAYLIDIDTVAWGTVTTGGPPWHLDRTPARWTPTPFPGLHDEEILAELAARSEAPAPLALVAGEGS